MKERPILFSAPMVRAILSGQKTQTRRVVKPIGNDEGFVILDYGNGGWPYRSDDGDSTTHTVKRGGKLYLDETPHVCPYGQTGDRLWVRETWADVGTCDPGLIVYRADYPLCVPRHYENVPPASEIRWRPSIHQRREHSRILLEITGVSVERLKDISEADARAEGIGAVDVAFAGDKRRDPVTQQHPPVRFADSYQDLWESINGPGSWDANPWVWVVEFKRVEGGAA